MLNTRLALHSEAFWGSRRRGADIDFLSLDLQLRDSQEGFDTVGLKTRHVDCEAEGRDAAGAISPLYSSRCVAKDRRPAVDEKRHTRFPPETAVLDRATAVAASLRDLSDERVRAGCRRGVAAGFL